MANFYLQISSVVAEKGFFEVADVSIALAVCLLMIMLFGWYVLKITKDFKAEKEDLREELKSIRDKREAEMKENINVMRTTQSTLQQIITSTQNLPATVENVINRNMDDIKRVINNLRP